MRTTISICTTLFLFSIVCTIVSANVVADPVLYLNAADNPAHPKAWKNLGTEGGELLAADKALSEAEINQNIGGTFAVDPADKLSTTWAKVKRGY